MGFDRKMFPGSGASLFAVYNIQKATDAPEGFGFSS